MASDEPTMPEGRVTAEETVTPEAPAMPQVSTAPRIKTAEERKELLARTIAGHVAQGWRVESQSDYQAVLVTGHRVNHVLHLILTIITALIWGIVWIALVIFGGEKRALVAVDEFGNVNFQRL